MDLGVKNPTVIKIITENASRRAFLFMQAGITYSIYSDMNNGSCKLYYKRKMMKRKAYQHFDYCLALG